MDRVLNRRYPCMDGNASLALSASRRQGGIVLPTGAWRKPTAPRRLAQETAPTILTTENKSVRKDSGPGQVSSSQPLDHRRSLITSSSLDQSPPPASLGTHPGLASRPAREQASVEVVACCLPPQVPTPPRSRRVPKCGWPLPV